MQKSHLGDHDLSCHMWHFAKVIFHLTFCLTFFCTLLPKNKKFKFILFLFKLALVKDCPS